MINDGSAKVSKPRPFLYREVKFDGKALIKALFKGGSHFLNGKPEEMVGDLGDVVTAFGLGNEPTELGWLLVHRSLWKAMQALIKEHWSLVSAKEKSALSAKEKSGLSAKAEAALTHAPLDIDDRFFNDPGSLPIVQIVAESFVDFLIGNDLAEQDARNIAGRLRSFFVSELCKEWRDHPETYAVLRNAIPTPFDAAAEREREWLNYYALLERDVDESLFGETFGLRQLYIPLRAYHEIGPRDQMGESRMRPDSEPKKREVLDLRTALDTWIEKADRFDPCRVISGGPGSGKSSFVKMYATYLAKRSSLRVLLIPLHHLDPKGDLAASVGAYVREARLFADNPLTLEKSAHRIVLIFDGLDELSMRGKVAEEIARDFLDEVTKTTYLRNVQALTIQVIISGRELTIQSHATAFRKEGEILHVLPYIVSEDRNLYFRNVEMLAEDQRQFWWRKYGELSGREYQGLPDELATKELGEITKHPLLNHIVALSYERDTVVFNENTVLNEVCYDLLKRVYERGYGGKPLPHLQEMEFGDFVRVLEEIALAVWHGAGRLTTIQEIKIYCERASLVPLLEKFTAGAEAGVTRLLTAFYFRQYGNTDVGDKTFEFTHKLFGDYLTARRINRHIQLTHRQLKRKEDEGGWTEPDALNRWCTICGRTPFDRAVIRFLSNELGRHSQADLIDIHDILCQLFGAALRSGLSVDKLYHGANHLGALKSAGAAEEALLVSINLCAVILKRRSQVPGTHEAFEAFGTWVNRISATGVTTTIPRHLSWLNLCESTLNVFLYGANLTHSDLSRSRGFGVRFMQCDFSWSRLEEASWPYSVVAQSVFRGANLSGIDMVEASAPNTIFDDAKLQNAKLNRCKLTRAKLRSANLTKAFLNEAILRFADLYRADLTDANFSDADLRGASLIGTIIEGANFAGAIVEEGWDRECVGRYKGTPVVVKRPNRGWRSNP